MQNKKLNNVCVGKSYISPNGNRFTVDKITDAKCGNPATGLAWLSEGGRLRVFHIRHNCAEVKDAE